MKQSWLKFSNAHFLFFIVTAGLAAVALPLSNLMTARHLMPVTLHAGRRFAEISAVLQTSCMDCHTPNLTHYPIYYHLPVAGEIIARDIRAGQTVFVITAEQLAGKVPLAAPQLVRMQHVFEDGSMPPLSYKLMHWNTFIGTKDRTKILAWIKEHNPDFGVKPVPVDNPFHPDVKRLLSGRFSSMTNGCPVTIPYRVHPATTLPGAGRINPECQPESADKKDLSTHRLLIMPRST